MASAGHRLADTAVPAFVRVDIQHVLALTAHRPPPTAHSRADAHGLPQASTGRPPRSRTEDDHRSAPVTERCDRSAVRTPITCFRECVQAAVGLDSLYAVSSTSAAPPCPRRNSCKATAPTVDLRRRCLARVRPRHGHARPREYAAFLADATLDARRTRGRPLPLHADAHSGPAAARGGRTARLAGDTAARRPRCGEALAGRR